MVATADHGTSKTTTGIQNKRIEHKDTLLEHFSSATILAVESRLAVVLKEISVLVVDMADHWKLGIATVDQSMAPSAHIQPTFC